MNIQDIRDNLQEYTVEQKRALAGVSLLAIAFSIFLFMTTRGSAVAQESPKPAVSISSIQSTIFVHVAGKVKKPDVYPLLKGARVADAIKAAGGPLKGVGTGNSYGHPNLELLASLRDYGAEVFRTDKDGSIAVAWRFDDRAARYIFTTRAMRREWWPVQWR